MASWYDTIMQPGFLFLGIVLLIIGLIVLVPGVRAELGTAANIGDHVRTGFGGILTLGGLIVVLMGSWGILLGLRVSRGGNIADAVVTDVTEIEGSFHGKKYTLWRIQFRYSDMQGHLHEAWIDFEDAGEAAAWPAGSVAKVRYDPKHPDNSIWLGAG